MTDRGGGNPNPFAQLAAAARGDLAAQRALAHAAMLRFYDDAGNPLPAECLGLPEAAALIEGLAFARMAESQGDESDRNRLIAMLSLGFLLPAECAIPIQAELIARASTWTESGALCGDDAEGADILMNQFTERASPTAVACAPIYRQFILESEAA